MNNSNVDLEEADINEISYTMSARQGRNQRLASQSQAFTTVQDRPTVPLVGPSPEQMLQQQQMATLTSPNSFHDENALNSDRGALSQQTRLRDHEKRQIVENFLMDDQVFKVLYDTVFTSPVEARQRRPEELIKTDSMD